MAIQSQSDLARELESVGMLRRVSEELDPRLELAAVQRRVFAAGGPALLFTNVKGTEFPVLANAFGQIDRARYIFRRTLSGVSALVGARANPQQLLQNPMQLLRAVRAAAHAFPLPAWRAPALQRRLRISDLPMIVGWPRDGGAFITLPQALSEHPRLPGWRHSNLGMYRVQLNGNRYQRDEEIGLHYQIRRGIGQRANMPFVLPTGKGTRCARRPLRFGSCYAWLATLRRRTEAGAAALNRRQLFRM